MVTLDSTNLNKMLEARARDLARERLPSDLQQQRSLLLKALGLHPLPPRTDLQVRHHGEISGDGFRVRQLVYQSRPGLEVSAYLYEPLAGPAGPVVVCAHGPSADKGTASYVQARGIGLALSGFTAIVIDAPGGLGSRAEMGSSEEPFLSMGAPAIGVYVWDLIRALDVLEVLGIDISKAAACGEHTGGEAALLAFAIDSRFTALTVGSAGGTWETAALSRSMAGAANLKDVAGILALRAPAPVLLMSSTQDGTCPRASVLSTVEKLKGPYGKTGAMRVDSFLGDWDYNRRMRETTYAFLQQHLMGKQAQDYAPELRPLTDGRLNLAPAGTLPADELRIETASSVTFTSLLGEALAEPYPEPFVPNERLVPWGKYGRIEVKAPESSILLYDLTGDGPRAGGVPLPVSEINIGLLVHLGLSAPEFFAQLLHLALPGGPEGWESRALTGDTFSAMLASVKTLVGASENQAPLAEVVAEGPVASLTASHLRLLRPGLSVTTSHSFGSWRELVESGLRALVQPGARYLKWPFAQTMTTEDNSSLAEPMQDV